MFRGKVGTVSRTGLQMWLSWRGLMFWGGVFGRTGYRALIWCPIGYEEEGLSGNH